MGDAACDLVVVGAGPAGCAAAAQALVDRPAACVLLLDRAEFPRDKACRDGVAAEAFDELDRLGLDAAALVEGYPPSTGCGCGRRAASRSTGGCGARCAWCLGPAWTTPS